MSQIAGLAAELSRVDAKLAPLNAYLSTAEPKAENLAAIVRAETEARPFQARHAELVHTIAASTPANCREALVLALTGLDYAWWDNVANEGGIDGNGTLFSAMRGLVAYLADAAGTAPDELGLFLDTLALTGLGKTPASRIATLVAELGTVWARNQTLDRQQTVGELTPSQARERSAEFQATEARSHQLACEIVSTPPATPDDARAVAVLIREGRGDVSDAWAAASVIGTAALIDYLALSGGAAPPAGLEYATGGHLMEWLEAPPAATAAPASACPQKSLREQFETMKARCDGAVVAFQSRYGFEFYGRDAVAVAAATGFVLGTRRDGEGGTIATCTLFNAGLLAKLGAKGLGNVSIVSAGQLTSGGVTAAPSRH